MTASTCPYLPSRLASRTRMKQDAPPIRWKYGMFQKQIYLYSVVCQYAEFSIVMGLGQKVFKLELTQDQSRHLQQCWAFVCVTIISHSFRLPLDDGDCDDDYDCDDDDLTPTMEKSMPTHNNTMAWFINIHFEHFQYLKHSKTVFSNIFRCKATRRCIWASHSDWQTKHPQSSK